MKKWKNIKKSHLAALVTGVLVIGAGVIVLISASGLDSIFEPKDYERFNNQYEDGEDFDSVTGKSPILPMRMKTVMTIQTTRRRRFRLPRRIRKSRIPQVLPTTGTTAGMPGRRRIRMHLRYRTTVSRAELT